MENHRQQRTLRKFVYIGDEGKIVESGLSRAKGHCRIILETLISYPDRKWTSRELWAYMENHPRFKSSTSTLRAANFWLWKMRDLGLIRWDDGK